MIPVAAPTSRSRIDYPDTDGLPIAENTFQYDWIVTIKGGLDNLFTDDPNVFVAGDLFWYPVEGHPEIVVAPDAMVVFGRPRGPRYSYLQWEEGGIAPQVVFEILSPSNRPPDMKRKFEFYREHGVEEYYIVDPDPQHLKLSGFLREGDNLKQIPLMSGHVSPRLKIKFELSDQGLEIVRPDGEAFWTFKETYQQVAQQRQRADQQQQRAEQEQQRAEQEQQRADQQQQRADQERQRAEQALAAIEQLRMRLRALGEDPS